MGQCINAGFSHRHMGLEGSGTVVDRSTDEDDAAACPQRRGLDLAVLESIPCIVARFHVRDFKSIMCFFADSIK